MKPLARSIPRSAERHVFVTVERISGSGGAAPSWLVKATDTTNPTVAHVRKFNSESDALAYAAEAAFDRFAITSRRATNAHMDAA